MKESTSTSRSHWLLVLIGAVLAACGLAFVVGGVVLLREGGSAYYVVAGALLLAVGIALALARSLALPLYGVLFAGTAIWAVAEAGLQFWPLFARLFFFLAFAFVLSLVAPLLRRKAGLAPAIGASRAASVVLLVAIVASLGGMFVERSTLDLAAATGKVPVAPQGAPLNWDNWGSNPGGERFAALDQINRDTVKNLKLAWTYRTGDVAENHVAGLGSEDQQTPLQIGDTVYLCTPHNNVIALASATGKELWKTEINARNRTWMRCRGLAYADLTGKVPNRAQVDASSRLRAQVAPAPMACGRRLYLNTVKAELIALDADTGRLCDGFGVAGRVDLRKDMGVTPEGVFKPTSAPTLAGDVLIVGGFVTDNLAVDVPSGVVRAYDAITGELRWAFDAGNPDIHKAPPPGQTYTRGSPNSWAGASYDPKMNLVFLPIGNAAPDLWGGMRTAAEEKYSSSVVALDASSGEVRWSFQAVHHDLWDFDVPMQPSLTDFPNADGSLTPAVVFGVKQGQIFVLDRATGKPLTRVEERPVPAGDLKGERYSPTQPVSTGMPQIGVKTLTEADMWGVTPFDQLLCRIDFKGMTHDGMFEPPTAHKQLVYPGSLGGMNWGGISVDPTSHTIFVNDMRLGLRLQAFERRAGDTMPKGSVPMTGAPYYVYKDRFLSALGVPCQAPPFGTMTAIDLKTQKINWQVPVGTVKDTGPLGIKLGLPIPVGMPTIGGSMATQGGLLFFAASLDYYLRAFDSGDGRELWKARLPVGSQATPITYRSSTDGKQYVLVSAGGARQSSERGDYVMAYTLP